MKPLVLIVLLCILCGCGGTYEPMDAGALADCYRAEFQSLPPAAVENLRAKQIIIRDAAGQWLRFTADAAVIRNLVAKGFQPSDREFFLHESGGANTPSWWKPEEDALATFWSRTGWRKDFSHSVAVLAYDAKQRVVYFHHGAFD